MRRCRRVLGAVGAPGHEVVTTVGDVDEEALGRLEGDRLATDGSDPLSDHRRPALRAPVEDLPDLREAHPDPLAGDDDPAPAEVLVVVAAMSGGCAVGHDDTALLPMPQHMRGDAEIRGGLSDPHLPIIAP